MGCYVSVTAAPFFSHQPCSQAAQDRKAEGKQGNPACVDSAIHQRIHIGWCFCYPQRFLQSIQAHLTPCLKPGGCGASYSS